MNCGYPTAFITLHHCCLFHCKLNTFVYYIFTIFTSLCLFGQKHHVRLFIYLFINQSTSNNTVYKITQFKKDKKQMYGLNGQQRAVPLTCSQKHYSPLRCNHCITVLDTNINPFQALRKKSLPVSIAF